MSLVQVRTANAAEVAAVDAHRVASRAESANFRGTVDVFDADAFIDRVTLVAEIDDAIVGSCVLSMKGSEAFVTHMYVDPDVRGIGVGDSLMSELLRRAAEISDVVRALALPGDRETKNLFERHGLTAQTIVVGRSLR